MEEHLNEIRPYLKDILNDFKKSHTWNLHLMIALKFMSSTDTDEERLIHSKSNNIEILINVKADEVIDKP